MESGEIGWNKTRGKGRLVVGLVIETFHGEKENTCAAIKTELTIMTTSDRVTKALEFTAWEI